MGRQPGTFGTQGIFRYLDNQGLAFMHQLINGALLVSSPFFHGGCPGGEQFHWHE